MRFGLFTMPEHPPHENWTLSYDRDIERIVLAEKLGFHDFWIGEHHTGGYENVPVPEYMIAKAAGLTSRIRLGTGVVNLPYHDPFLVAERLAFLDHLTHGRLDYGFGGGGLPSDRALFGLDAAEAKPRTDEALEIITHLLTSREPFSYEGRFNRFTNRRLQVPPLQQNPPIAVAGLTGTHNFELCGRNNWKALSVYFTPLVGGGAVPDLRDHAAALMRGAAEGGQSPEAVRDKWAIVREVYVSHSRDQAIAELREGVKTSYDYLKGLGLGVLMKKDMAMPDEDLTFEWMADEIPWIIGSPADCIRQIHELREETGGFGSLLINVRDWTTSDLFARSLELFARYVVPQFNGQNDMSLRRQLADEALGR